MRCHVEKRRESLAFNSRVDSVAFNTANELARDMIGGLEPTATQGAAVVAGVALKIDIVAVAGAPKRQLEVVPAPVRVVTRPAPDLFMRPALQRDVATADPGPGQFGEGALLRMARKHRQRQRDDEYRHTDQSGAGICQLS